MSNQPLAAAPNASTPPSSSREFISPLARTAIAIREWQARLQARQNAQDTSDQLLSDD